MFREITVLMCLFSTGCMGEREVSHPQQITDTAWISHPHPDLPFGTYDLSDAATGQPQALIEGTLFRENNCIYLQNADRRYAPLFPAQHTQINTATHTLIILSHEIEMGSRIKTNGGYFDFEDAFKLNLSSSIPTACEAKVAVIIGTEAWTP